MTRVEPLRPGLIPSLFLLVVLAGASSLPAAQGVRIRHDGKTLGPTPIVTRAPETLETGHYTLQTEGQGQKPIPALVFSLDGKRHLGLVLDALESNQDLSYSLTPSSPPETGVAIAGKPSEKHPDIALTIDGKPFATLVLSHTAKPYIYPLFGPNQKPFTRAYPMEQVEGEDKDHPHQRSFWFTHGDVNGFDFWASDPLNGPNPKFGKIKAHNVKIVGSDKPAPLVLIRHQSDWLDNNGKKLLADDRTLTFYGSSTPRFVDVDITLRAGDEPVTFGDTKEGSFGLRIASSLDVKRKQGGKITNAEGITDNDAWGKTSAWVDYTGKLDDDQVGVAILNHPDSFRFPTAWHVRDYGLFAANPFGYKDFKIKEEGAHTLQPGQSIHFGYRVILHEGDTPAANIPSAFAAYAHPPKVEFTAR